MLQQVDENRRAWSDVGTDHRPQIVRHPTHQERTLAGFNAALGEKDKAFTILEKLYEKRAGELTAIKVDPRFDNLRDDPRFQDLVRRMGLLQ